MSILRIPKDAWIAILGFLAPIDILRIKTTCKTLYRASKSGLINTRISGGMIKGYPSFYQWECINQILSDGERIRIIGGQVGSGKTIVGIVSALLLAGSDPKSKLYIVVPPNLLVMWQEELSKKFGIEPFLLYSTNKSYGKDLYKDDSLKNYKIILTSQINFTRMSDRTNNVTNEDILLCDEYKKLNYTLGKVIIGLNATYKGKRNILPLQKDSKIALDPIKHFEYDLPIPKSTMTQLVDYAKEHGLGFSYNIMPLYVMETYISYPFLNKCKAPEQVKIGRKKFTRGIYSLLTPKDPNETNFYYYLAHSPKFSMLLHILKNIKRAKQKVIIFDRNIDFLPYIAKILLDFGYKVFLFTTDYTPSSRTKQLEAFKSCKGSAILLSSYRMMGEGHCISEANHVVFYSPTSDDAKYTQCLGRCHRFPQKKQVYAYHLYSTPLDRYIKMGGLLTFEKGVVEFPMYGHWSYARGELAT